MPLYLDIIVNVDPQAAERPILSRKRTTQPGTLPVVTAGDGWNDDYPLFVRLWFYSGAPQSLTSTNVRKAGVPLAIVAKRDRTPGSPVLFDVTGFTEIQDSNLDYGYEARLKLNTVALLAATAGGSPVTIWADITEGGSLTNQFSASVRPQVNSGGDPAIDAEPPYPSSTELRATTKALHSADLALSQRLDDQLAALVTVTPFALIWVNDPFSGALGTGALTDFSTSGNLFEGTIPGDAANYMCGASLTGFPAGARLRLTGAWTTDGLVGGNPGLGVFDAAGNNLNPVWIGENTTGALLACECELPAGAAWLVAARVPEAGAGNPTAGTFGVSELDCDALNAPTLAESLDAKADKISGGTAGNVVIRDAGGNMEDSGYSIAPANTFAGDDKLVVGSDPRLGMPGGMRYDSGSFEIDALGGGAPCGPVQTKVWVGIPQEGAFCNLAGGGGGRMGFVASGGTIWRCLDNFEIDLGIPVPTTPTVYTLECTPGQVRWLVGGVEMSIYTGSDSFAVPLALRPDGWVRPLTGRCVLQRQANFALTSDEALGASRNEAVGRLAYRANNAGAWINNPYEYVAQGGEPYQSFSSSGPDNLTVSSTTNYYSGAGVRVTGRSIRVKGTVVSTDSPAPFFTALDSSGATVGGTWTVITGGGVVATGSRLYVSATGSFEAEFTANSRVDVILFRYSDAVGGTAMSAFSARALGTVANYAPENCLPSGAWPDSSGNCHDLAPVVGATALNPKSSHTRRIAVTCAGSGAIGANASASVGVLAGIGAADTAAIAAIKAGSSVTAQFGTSMPAHIVGLIANAPSAGAPVVRAHADATGDTVAAGTVINLTHTQS